MWWDEALNTNKMSQKDATEQLNINKNVRYCSQVSLGLIYITVTLGVKLSLYDVYVFNDAINVLL